MQVWVNTDSDENIGKIAKSIDGAIAKAGPDNLKGFFVFVPKKGEDTKAIESRLQKLSDSNGLKYVALTYVSGPEDDGVGNYKINTSQEVKNTVLVYVRHKISANFVNLQGDEKGLGDLNSALAAITK